MQSYDYAFFANFCEEQLLNESTDIQHYKFLFTHVKA